MTKNLIYFCLLVFLIVPDLWISPLKAQEDTLSIINELGGDGYREGQYPGLGRAASQIFYSESWLTFSGYAELATIFDGGKLRDTSSGDLELYYNQMIRIVPFIGIRLSSKLIWTTEFGIEYLEGNQESHGGFFPESYFDYLIRDWINIRFGLQPLYTGYINNNEEPLLYFSVNRPEVERLIIPSEWIEAGIASYGEFSNKFNYALMLTNGVRAEEFRSPTWIRGGSEGQLKNFNRLAFSAQLNYLPISNITLCLTGYYNQSGRGRTIDIDGTPYAVEAPLSLFSGYIRWDHENFTMIGLGSYGLLEETYEIYHLTELEQGIGQVIGKEVYGFYMELGYDILPMFSNSKSKNARPGHFFTINNPTLPLFLRLERLDTHADIDQRLKDFSYFRNNLLIWILGCNYQPNHNLVVKFDVRFRDNLSASPDQPAKETLYELGIGIEF